MGLLRFEVYFESKLDMPFCIQNWLEIWDSFACLALPRQQPNHNPLLITYYKHNLGRLRPFHFLFMWTFHESYPEMVKYAWSILVLDYHVFHVVAKLQIVNRVLWVWNNSIFGDVNKKIQQAVNEVGKAQFEILVKDFSDERLNVEVQAHKKLDNLLNRHKFLFIDKCMVN